MQPNQHANLLSIFAWIIAGFQLLIVLFYGLYVLFFGGVMIAAALDPETSDPVGIVFGVVFVSICALVTLFGIVGMVSNFQMGRRLRSGTVPTQRSILIASIINCASVFTGGMFAMGLGIYGLWFSMSDSGKLYFSGQGHLTANRYSSQPQTYQINAPQTGPTPYKWQ